MRILSVSNCPALEHLGSGYVIANFNKGLRALGHKVDLLQPDDYEICQWLRPRAISYRQAVGILYAVRRALRYKSYDLIEFWGAEAWLATWWLTRRQNHRPMIVQHTNGPEPRYNQILQDLGILKFNRLQAWHVQKLLAEAFACADGIVAVSESDRLWLAKYHPAAHAKLEAIDVPLPDCFTGRPIRRRATGVIGFSGTWLLKKGIDVLVSDMTNILRTFPGWRLLVLGTNSTDAVRSFFPSDIRSKVDVVPMIKDKEALAQRYEQMEIFVLPSRIESFGIALAEAMACGCAPVTTRVGFGAALAHEKDALILPQAQSPYLYQAVKRLILNPELRQRLGAEAWERVQGLRWDRAAKTLSRTYEQWLAEQRRAVGHRTKLPVLAYSLSVGDSAVIRNNVAPRSLLRETKRGAAKGAHMHADSSAYSLPRMSLQLIQIVPRLPPALSGVGDYAYLLARELRAAHGIDTRFIVCDASWSSGKDIDGFSVEQMDGNDANELERRINAAQSSAPVMVHYVGYGYQKRGCPLWLLRGLEAWKQKHFARSLLVMFHELYAFGAPWRSSFWTSPLQRWITARLARLADTCRSNYLRAALELERMAPEQVGRIDVFPVFSNFGEPARTEPLQVRCAQAVICGAILRDAKQTSARRRILAKACRYLGVEKVVVFGATDTGFDIPDITTERRFVLSPAAASVLLAESRIGLLDYNDGCLGKSGVFASYCAHGMLSLLVSSDGSRADEVRAGVHYLRANDIDAPVSISRQQRVASNAQRWYGEHNLSATAHSLAQSIKTLTPPTFARRSEPSFAGAQGENADFAAASAGRLVGDSAI